MTFILKTRHFVGNGSRLLLCSCLYSCSRKELQAPTVSFVFPTFRSKHGTYSNRVNFFYLDNKIIMCSSYPFLSATKKGMLLF